MAKANRAKKADLPEVPTMEYADIYPHVLSGLCANSNLIAHSSLTNFDGVMRNIVDTAQKISMMAAGMLPQEQEEAKQEAQEA